VKGTEVIVGINSDWKSWPWA